MRVLILPAAGNGTRFAKEGFTLPKPFIECDGATMIERAYEPFHEGVDRLVIISQEAHEQFWVNRDRPYTTSILDPETMCDNVSVHFISHFQEGAALSVLSAIGQVSDDDEIIIANSDQFFSGDLSPWFDYLDKTKVDGSILTFTQEGGPWSFATVSRYDPSLVTRIAEKEAISNIATCGVYYFRNWRLLRTAICSMVADNERYNGEFYLAPVYNHVIKHGGSVRIFDASEFGFTPVGTPEQLKSWLSNEEAT